jgi:uncharacterized integral membrane protein
MHDDDEIPPVQERTAPGYEGRRGVPPTLIGFVVLAILAVIFIVENGRKTDVRLIIPLIHTRVWVVIVVSMAIGVIVDRLFQAWWRRRRDR